MQIWNSIFKLQNAFNIQKSSSRLKGISKIMQVFYGMTPVLTNGGEGGAGNNNVFRVWISKVQKGEAYFPQYKFYTFLYMHILLFPYCSQCCFSKQPFFRYDHTVSNLIIKSATTLNTEKNYTVLKLYVGQNFRPTEGCWLIRLDVASYIITYSTLKLPLNL